MAGAARPTRPPPPDQDAWDRALARPSPTLRSAPRSPASSYRRGSRRGRRAWAALSTKSASRRAHARVWRTRRVRRHAQRYSRIGATSGAERDRRRCRDRSRARRARDERALRDALRHLSARRHHVYRRRGAAGCGRYDRVRFASMARNACRPSDSFARRVESASAARTPRSALFATVDLAFTPRAAPFTFAGVIHAANNLTGARFARRLTVRSLSPRAHRI